MHLSIWPPSSSYLPLWASKLPFCVHQSRRSPASPRTAVESTQSLSLRVWKGDAGLASSLRTASRGRPLRERTPRCRIFC